MTNCIVTGGAGFIGSHLVDRLLAEEWKVTVIDNFQSGYWSNLEAIGHPNLSVHVDDLSHALYAPRVEVIFHCAALARTPWCVDDPRLCFDCNVSASLYVLDFARETGARLVMSSSNVVYAAHTPYRASKETMEGWARAYHDCYGTNVVCLRYSNVYGSRQSEDGPSPNVFAALRKSAKEKGCLEITGDGEQSRDYTHVSDIVEANWLAAHSNYGGDPLDCCTGNNYTLNEVAKMFGYPIRYVPERPNDVKHIYQDPKPAHDILGWKAQVKLTDGIKEVLP